MSLVTYKEKPVVETVEAIQFDGKPTTESTPEQIRNGQARWEYGGISFVLGEDVQGVHGHKDGLVIRPGQWLVKGHKGDLSVMSDDDFNAHYEQ